MDLPIIDTHQHLWDPARFSYSWMNGLPAIRGRRLIEEYRDATGGMNVVGSVYVDTDVDEADLAEEIKMIFALADDPANRVVGVVAGAHPEHDSFLDHLRPFLAHPKLKGVRRVLHTQPDGMSRSAQFVEQVRSLAEHDLSFDICMLARQLPLAVQLVRACPRVAFILDHCGNPDIRGRAFEAWQKDLSTLAREPNVVCKISGLVTCAEVDELSAATLRPYVEHVLAAFGWERVLWGGDWPVCTLATTLRHWRAISQELFATASREQQERLFFRNAVRVYRLAGALPATSP